MTGYAQQQSVKMTAEHKWIAHEKEFFGVRGSKFDFKKMNISRQREERRKLAEENEDLKKLCYLMLVKLAQVAPTAVAQRLDDTVPTFTATLEATLKDTAVKQETERLAELQKATLRCLVVLNRLASPANTPKFVELVQKGVLGGKWANEVS